MAFLYGPLTSSGLQCTAPVAPSIGTPVSWTEGQRPFGRSGEANMTILLSSTCNLPLNKLGSSPSEPTKAKMLIQFWCGMV